MQQLPEMKAAYDWFFTHYSADIADRARSNDMVGIAQMEAKRDVLERGTFVLMFGQFEAAVNAAFANARNARVQNPDWTKRRGWDVPELQNRKVKFETKLALVMDAKSVEFREVLNTYGIRNHCAHGGTTNPVGSIDALVSDLYRWQSAINN